MVEVKGARAAAGVGVWAQESVALTKIAPGVQLNPIAGALAPKGAADVIVRLAPPVIEKFDAPVAGIVHANATAPAPIPTVCTFTGTDPVPAASVAAESGATTGAVSTTGAVMLTTTVCPTHAPAILLPTESEQLTFVNVIEETAATPAEAFIVIEPANT